MLLLGPQGDSTDEVLEQRLAVKAAGEFSGYDRQYLRLLLRIGRLDSIRIGQV